MGKVTESSVLDPRLLSSELWILHEFHYEILAEHLGLYHNNNILNGKDYWSGQGWTKHKIVEFDSMSSNNFK